MSNKRKAARKKRQQGARLNPPVLDVHGEHLLGQMADLEGILGAITSADDPSASVQEQFDDALRELAAEAQAGGPPTGEEPEVQEMSHLVSHAKDDLDLLLNLSHLRAAMAVDRSAKLAFISMLARGSQVMIRNTSYADMAERTVTDLLDGEADVHTELVAGLGLDAHDAIQVLTAVHKIQQDQINERGEDFVDALNDLRDAAEAGPTQRIGSPKSRSPSSRRC